MAGSLNAFLNPIEVKNKEIVISERFVEDGKPVEWEIRAIGEKENDQIIKRCTKRDRKTGNEQFDRSQHAHELAAAAVVFPDLKNADLQKRYNVLGEAELLKAMLTIGEFSKLSEEVSTLSGLDENDINTEIEDAKNS